jgi:hypothetical protein
VGSPHPRSPPPVGSACPACAELSPANSSRRRTRLPQRRRRCYPDCYRSRTPTGANVSVSGTLNAGALPLVLTSRRWGGRSDTEAAAAAFVPHLVDLVGDVEVVKRGLWTLRRTQTPATTWTRAHWTDPAAEWVHVGGPERTDWTAAVLAARVLVQGAMALGAARAGPMDRRWTVEECGADRGQPSRGACADSNDVPVPTLAS